MKQIEKTSQILAKLRKAVGSEVDTDKLAVYEAIAFNTLPIRKRHPLYNKGRADKALLEEMAASLTKESRPLQVMHNGEMLPVGRVFAGEVVDTTKNNAELRVLFYVEDGSDYAKNIDLGIVDQVSVSVLSKQLLCSDCGFDYLGPDASPENFWSATCSEGHVLGEGKTHAKLVGLDDWFEMSLVNRGGAQNARIVSRDKSHFQGPTAKRLAASGTDPNLMILTATAETEKTMDFEALAAQLVDLRVEKKGFEKQVADLTAANTTLTGKVTELEAKLAEAGEAAANLAAKDGEIANLKADADKAKETADAALALLKDVAKTLLIASGEVDPTLPESVDELNALITEKKASLAAALVVGGKSLPAGGSQSKPAVLPASAFKTR